MDEQIHKFKSASEKAESSRNVLAGTMEMADESNDGAVTPTRPNAMDVLLNDKQSAKETDMALVTPTPKSLGEESRIKFDMDIVKSCIKRIHVLDKTQNDRAMQATARNRKMK